MKKALSLVLCSLAISAQCATFVPQAAAAEYYPKYSGTSISIVDALQSLNVDSTYNHRAKIAQANNIQNYKGTAVQNTQMLNLLKQGTLVKEAATTTTAPAQKANCYKAYLGQSTSIVDALNSLGYQSAYEYRTRIAAANNIKDYKGTATQNTQMLNLLKKGDLKFAVAALPATTTTTTQPAASTTTAQSVVKDGKYIAYTGTSVSIVDALQSLGIESGYQYRAMIAKANNIQNYKGTAEQNTYMLNLLKKGELKVAVK